ncbi:MAG: nucleotide exchange factor GrpE [Deferribacteraceae bacterium]|jgi:molecular chaperone GrpE|nr:nucleotide exchange factor GrpE [Deferribacteraceae bacterium]
MSEDRDHIEELLDEEETVELDETELLRKQIKELNDKILRQAADAENYRKRLIKETDDKIKYANQSLIAKFLPVLDNFDLALQHRDSSTVEVAMEGVALNQRVLIDLLEKAGMSKIETAIGDPFDPASHEAIMMTNNPDLPDNSVAMVVQNGYIMSGRVIRPAKVQVNKIN